MPPRGLKICLLDLDVAGACADADGGAAAVDDTTDVMTVEAALHGDGLRDVDAAGAGVGVKIEAAVADGEADGTATGGEFPVGGGLTLGVDITAAGAGFETAGYSLKTDAATAGFGFDVAWVRQRHLQSGISSPVALLAAASQRTHRIELGTAVIPLGWENPLRLAEDLATVDVLSGGRLNVGVGAGWIKSAA